MNFIISIKKQQLAIVKILLFYVVALMVTLPCSANFSPTGKYGESSWIESMTKIANEKDTTNETNISSRSILTLLHGNGQMYAGTWDGVFVLKNNSAHNASNAANETPNPDQQAHLSSYSWGKIGADNNSNTPTKVLALQLHKYVIYAGTRDQGVFKRVLSPGENGYIWESAGLKNESILTLYSSRDGFLYTGTNKGKVYRLNEKEGQWECISQVKTKNVHALCGYNTYLYAGTDGGEIFAIKTTQDRHNPERNWRSVGLTNLTDKPILALVTVGANLYAGSYGGGVFRGVVNDHNIVWNDTGLENKQVFFLLSDEYRFLYAATSDGYARRSLVE